MRCARSPVEAAQAELALEALHTGGRALGLESRFRQLYDDYFDLVCGLIARFGVASPDVEDLTQQVFVVVHRRLAETPDLRDPSAWLRAVSVRVVHEHYRWRKIRRVHQWIVEHSWAGRSVDEWTPEGAAAAQEQLHVVRRVLQRMSSKLRDTLVLLELEELEASEVAEILGIPLNTVRSRRSLARIEFRKLWRQATGGSEPEHDWADKRASHDH